MGDGLSPLRTHSLKEGRGEEQPCGRGNNARCPGQGFSPDCEVCGQRGGPPRGGEPIPQELSELEGAGESAHYKGRHLPC